MQLENGSGRGSGRPGGVRLARWVLLGVGLALLLIAVFIWQSNEAFSRSSLRAEGTVVEMTSRRSTVNGRTTRTYCPTVEFVAADGRTVSFETRVCSSPAAYEVGDRVTVLYQADHPDQATVDDFLANWLAVLIVASIGCVALIFAGAITVFLRRSRSGSHPGDGAQPSPDLYRRDHLR